MAMPLLAHLVQSEYADGSVTASKIASKTIGKDQISDSILGYLKPRLQHIQHLQFMQEVMVVSFLAENKYLIYQWKRMEWI